MQPWWAELDINQHVSNVKYIGRIPEGKAKFPFYVHLNRSHIFYLHKTFLFCYQCESSIWWNIFLCSYVAILSLNRLSSVVSYVFLTRTLGGSCCKKLESGKKPKGLATATSGTSILRRRESNFGSDSEYVYAFLYAYQAATTFSSRSLLRH